MRRCVSSRNIKNRRSIYIYIYIYIYDISSLRVKSSYILQLSGRRSQLNTRFDTAHFFFELSQQYIWQFIEDFYAIIVCSFLVYCKRGARLQRRFSDAGKTHTVQDKVHCIGILANNEIRNSHTDPGDQFNLEATAEYGRPAD